MLDWVFRLGFFPCSKVDESQVQEFIKGGLNLEDMLTFTKRFPDCFSPFSDKHNCKQTFVNKNLYSHYKLLYWWGCVKKQRNIYKAFEFVSVVKNQ